MDCFGRAVRILLVVCVGTVFSGCAATTRTYYRHKVPETKENLAVFRECQRTAAMAGYSDTSEYVNRYINCLRSIPEMSNDEIAAVSATSATPAGCRMLETVADNVIVYACRQ
jgi:hypothetical protein